MSYDISLNDPVTKVPIEIDSPHFIQGGTYQVGGTKELWLNITYNYGRYYCKAFEDNPKTQEKGIRAIYGLTGLDSIPIIEKAIDKLKSDEIPDLSPEERAELEADNVTGYWLPTKENALKPLYSLITFAKMRPDGVWGGD